EYCSTLDGMLLLGIRMRRRRRLVLGALARSSPDDPAWGYRICEETGLGSGAVYKVLEKLEAAGLVHGYREVCPLPGWPARRFVELTCTGRELARVAQDVLASRSAESDRGLRSALSSAVGGLRER